MSAAVVSPTLPPSLGDGPSQSPEPETSIIRRLWMLKGQFLHQPIPEEDIYRLCIKARRSFMSEPTLLDIQAPVNVCGDIHGQFNDLLSLFDLGGHPPLKDYLFLGDYVDRGSQSIETICLLFAYKLLYPDKFHILRGNHEDKVTSSIFGFKRECTRRYNVKLWMTFCGVFDCMPFAAIIETRIFCAHGGLSPELMSMNQIRRVLRPTGIPSEGLLCDLVWSDPDLDIHGWGDNSRGVSYTFGADVVERFLKKFDLDLVCRAHEVAPDGYQFFADRRCVTVFSAPNYVMTHGNSAAIMTVDRSLTCGFKILRSEDNVPHIMYGRRRHMPNYS